MSRKVILYLAISLDGYISDAQGGVNWLHGEDPAKDTADSYQQFLHSVDTVVLGAKTYDQIRTELSPDMWPYDKLHSYVLTCRPRPQPEDKHVTFASWDAAGLVRSLQKKPGKNIWICGGATLANTLIRENMIDVYHLTIIPVLLGSGLRLFEETSTAIPLHTEWVRVENGITEIVYTRR